MAGGDETRSYYDRLVDESALRDYLADRLGPTDRYAVERHEAGHSNETLFVTWGDRSFTLRRPPPGETAETAHDVLREYRVLEALQGTTVRVPETVLACEDHSVIGSDFYLMERVAGDVLRDEEPARFATPETRRHVGEELVDRLADIHPLDYDGIGLGEFGYPDGYTERQVDRWSKQLAWAFEVTEDVRRVPTIEAVGDWLRDNVPADYPHTLVHGDYKLDNVMFGPSSTPHIAAILDWEMSTLGDPRCDLGWMLIYWYDAKDPELSDFTSTFMTKDGYPTRTELVDRYEAKTGIAFEHERFYRALAVYKLCGIGEMFFRRHLEGNADDPEYPGFEERVPRLADRALRIIEGEEPL